MIADTIQNLPPGMNGLSGKDGAHIVNCTAITVPIVRAPLGTAAFHKVDPATPSALETSPLPKRPATAPIEPAIPEGFRG